MNPPKSRAGDAAPRGRPPTAVGSGHDRLDIHLIAIGGTGMAPLACLLKGRGHRVRGSDSPLYPPMSTLLSEASITPRIGFDPDNLEPRPDLVIVGNAIPRENPEAVAAERLGIPRLSMPEALASFFLHDRRPLVLAGTHGKTTTAAMAAWVYSFCGVDPGYLVGGLPRNFERSFHDGNGERFIIEGDEYNAAYFDRGAKFLHYRPETLLLTSVEYDHADLYPDPAALVEAYEQLVELVSEDGFLAACGDNPEVREVAGRAKCPVVFYGLGAKNDIHPAGRVRTDASGSRFRIVDHESGEIDIALASAGEHNVANALAVWAAARRDGFPAEQVAEALRQFQGVRRRMELLGTAAGVSVIDDFAHHPTAVAATLEALRQRYPARRLVAVFEPRTLTAGRHRFFAAYRRAFHTADRVFLAPVFHAARLAPEEGLDLDLLTRRLAADGIEASAPRNFEELLGALTAETREGDVVVIMSSGQFGCLPQRLFESLEGSSGGRLGQS